MTTTHHPTPHTTPGVDRSHLIEDGLRVYYSHLTPTVIRRLIHQHGEIVAAENARIANGQPHTETRDRERAIVGSLLDELDRRAYGTTATARRYQHFPSADGATIRDTITDQNLTEIGDLVIAGAMCRRLETAATAHERALILAGAR